MADKDSKEVCVNCEEPTSGMRCSNCTIVYSYATNFTKQTDVMLDDIND